MVGTVLFAGCLFYQGLYTFCRKILHYQFGSALSVCDQYVITEKCVNGFQGILSTIVGAVVVVNCHGNIMDDRHWLTNSFALFGIPYFLYDLKAMYSSYYYQNFQLFESYTASKRMKHFISNNMLMVVHHIVLPVIFFPSIMYFRANRGDYFVGVFYMFEAALPFIAIRFILAQLKLKHTVAYLFFGILMIVMFFITRILIFPYLFWRYGQHSGTPFAEVPFKIPLKCILGCLTILVVQVWILYLMVRGAFRVFYKYYTKTQTE